MMWSPCFAFTVCNAWMILHPARFLCGICAWICVFLHSQVQKVHFPTSEKCISEVVRITLLTKLWKAKFFIPCDFIFVVRLQGKFDLTRLLEHYLRPSWPSAPICCLLFTLVPTGLLSDLCFCLPKQEGHSKEVYDMAFQIDGSLLATWWVALRVWIPYLHDPFMLTCLAAVTLELKKRAKQTNMLEPRLHES